MEKENSRMSGKWAKGNGNVGKGGKAVGGKEREEGKGDNGLQHLLTNSKSACGLVSHKPCITDSVVFHLRAQCPKKGR